MALSNWDTLAFDSEGKACDGKLEGFLKGTFVEFYKNWLYIHDEASWVEGRGYMAPVVAKVSSGFVDISGFEIISKRGPQESIFAYAECHDYKNKQERRMAGISCYGYDDPSERLLQGVGLDPKKYEVVDHATRISANLTELVRAKNKETGEEKEYELANAEGDYDSQYVGVLPSTFEEFMSWLKEVDELYEYDKEYKLWVGKIEENPKIRFNQGDAFFAGHAEADIPGSSVGKASAPVIESILQNKKGEKS